MQVMTAFYPEANGAVERFHWQLKDSLWAGLDRLDWLEHLPWILLGLRAAPREDFGVSAAELVHGSPLFFQGSSSWSPSRHLPPSYSNFAHPFLGVGQDRQRPAAAGCGPGSAATNVYVRLPLVLPVLSPAYRRRYCMRPGGKILHPQGWWKAPSRLGRQPEASSWYFSSISGSDISPQPPR
jgi:hypothetical protein